MADIARGEKLWDEAYRLLEGRLSMDQVTFDGLARRKANEISEYFDDHYGQNPSLDQEAPEMVAELGKAYDALWMGASETYYKIMPSPLWTGIKSAAEGIATQKPTMDVLRNFGTAAGDAAKNAFKGAHRWIYAGLAGLGLLATVIIAWKWRRS